MNTKLTLTAPKEMESLLGQAKKDLFNNNTRSYIIRELIKAGLGIRSEEENKGEKGEMRLEKFE